MLARGAQLVDAVLWWNDAHGGGGGGGLAACDLTNRVVGRGVQVDDIRNQNFERDVLSTGSDNQAMSTQGQPDVNLMST